MRSGLKVLDRELQAAAVKELFLPLQNSRKNPRTAKRVKSWYELPTGPNSSPKKKNQNNNNKNPQKTNNRSAKTTFREE